jgi:acyl-CoA synthetase (AMP-forming)/AMP-acid ligase II
MVRASASRFADRVAVEDSDVVWTFADLRREVDRAARALVASGIGVGDRVAIWAPNIHEWIPAALGVHAVGAVLVPLNTRYKGREAAYILNRSGARLLFTVSDFLDTDYVAMLGDADEGVPALEEVVVLRGDAAGDGLSGTDLTAWEDFLARGSDGDQAEVDARVGALGPDDLCDIMFTSGTTGHPKGVLSTHGQSLRAFQTWSRLVGLRDDDRYLVVNPFFHTFGYKAGILAAVMRGATLLPHAVFDAEQVLRRIEADRVTMLPGPPALYQTILNHPDRASMDLSSLRLAVTGAAAIPVSLIERMRGELGFETVLTAYGLTEATGVVSMCRDGDDAETIATTSGRAIPDVEVRIVDDSGVEVSRGEPGEIVVRGYNVTQGYLDDPDATAEAIDPDGWLHTGDIGVMDDRGYIDITDRKKDMFIVGGFNAYPAEIENDLSEHPAVAQVAVVGMPDERLGEVGCAFVVPAVGATVDPDEVIAWARDRMANFKVPRRVEVVDALPTNPSGKVLKYALREQLNA